eukprot:2396814-Amphidinium_carterae.1
MRSASHGAREGHMHGPHPSCACWLALPGLAFQAGGICPGTRVASFAGTGTGGASALEPHFCWAHQWTGLMQPMVHSGGVGGSYADAFHAANDHVRRPYPLPSRH